MIVIYSKDVDDFVNQVIDELDEEFVRIGETDEVILEEMDFSNESSSYKISGNYFESVNLDKIKSIWFNGGCIYSVGDDYENKCYEVLNDSFLIHKSVKKIGKRIADFETNRLDMMLEAKAHGLRIPHTLVTGSKQKLGCFHDLYKNKNGIICKRILDSYFYEKDDYLYNFNLTFPITDPIFNEIPNEFSISFFQETIIADFEIRVIYIDGLFYSVAIHDFVKTIDYRTKFRNSESLRIIPFSLPSNIQSSLESVFKKFNLNYGSADLMYCNNEYFFLEINPTGQISFINNACNLHIEKRLSEKLKNG